MSQQKKQALLLIHGMGEQRPMDSLRSFVEAVWTSDKRVKLNPKIDGTYSKPDMISGSFELRRLTTSQNIKNKRTDFYEFYWAHLMQGNTISQVVAWSKGLILRWPWKVPPKLFGAWLLIVILLLIFGFFALLTILPEEYQFVNIPKYITGPAGLFTAFIAPPIIKNVIGDAARYLYPSPENIQRRQEIRTKGVELLRKLINSGKYDRIIVVGHSLGSVVGYDLLTYAWALYNDKVDKTKSHPVLDELEKDVVEGKISVKAFQNKQRDLLEELKRNFANNTDSNEQSKIKTPWIVSDFITMGSPLAHADVLIEANKDSLRLKQKQRELPRCPPELEKGKNRDLFSYPEGADFRVMHHAAVFGPTRWTNIYFPSKYLFYGDFIGGKISRVFGRGVLDIPVKTKQNYGYLTHRLYWTLPEKHQKSNHIKALRKAINLLDVKHDLTSA